MAPGDAYLEKADAVLLDLFQQWSLSTTIIATLLFFYFAYPWLTWKDPDVHPFLLARQASPSPIRQPGESAIYRSIEIPYGYPLRAGLGVKDPGAPKWSSGRNGDIRDVWRQAARGPLAEDGTSAGPKAKLYTVLGREKVIERELDSVTQEINAVGKHMQEAGGKKVAICLSNSVELLAGIFAASFYSLEAVLVPHGLTPGVLNKLLSMAGPDVLIAEAGSVDIPSTISECPSLKHVIWVSRGDAQHMDFNEVPEGGNVQVSTWHSIVEDRKATTSSEVPPFDKESKDIVQPLSLFWPLEGQHYDLTEYTSENIVAAVAALIAAGSRNHKLGPSDIVLPASPLTFSYPLCMTFAALYSHASVALNSVAGEDVNFEAAISGISPTVVIASSKTVSDFHDNLAALNQVITFRIRNYLRRQTLQAGNMPPKQPMRGRLAASLSKLRLLMVYSRPESSSSPRLSSNDLTNLRSGLGVRIAYALVAKNVAGAVSQTNILDYRSKSGLAHFGPPLSSVEIRLTGDEDDMGKAVPHGKIAVKGPAVVDGETTLNLTGVMGEDNTLLIV